MKVAFCGASSTGKSTLRRTLMMDAGFSQAVGGVVASVDARSLIREYGGHRVDELSDSAYCDFQFRYIQEKIIAESRYSAFVTERSFIDAMAYWEERCSNDPRTPEVIDTCLENAKKYDLHVYLKFGVIQFENDGYRAPDQDYHRRIDEKIHSILLSTSVKMVHISTPVLSERVKSVLNAIR